MATKANLMAFRIDSLDVTAFVQSGKYDGKHDVNPTTAMGASGLDRDYGLKDESFELTLFSDFANSSVDAKLWALYNGGSAFLVEAWPTAGTVTSAANPKYSGTCILPDYAFGGAATDLLMVDVVLPVKGTVSRATS